MPVVANLICTFLVFRQLVLLSALLNLFAPFVVKNVLHDYSDKFHPD